MTQSTEAPFNLLPLTVGLVLAEIPAVFPSSTSEKKFFGLIFEFGRI